MADDCEPGARADRDPFERLRQALQKGWELIARSRLALDRAGRPDTDKKDECSLREGLDESQRSSTFLPGLALSGRECQAFIIKFQDDGG